MNKTDQMNQINPHPPRFSRLLLMNDERRRREEWRGGFKFQVQRVNNDAVAHRLPGAWQS